jgi:outer membrane lipoprotein SlyB
VDKVSKIKVKVQAGALLLGFVASISLLSSCQTTNQGGPTFAGRPVLPAMRSFHGKILHVEEVQIQGNETGAGAAAWGVLDGKVSSSKASGRGTTLANLGDTAAGAAAVERARGARPAWELEVEQESGEVLVIVQDQEQDDTFEVGDHVRVIEGRDGSFRVRQ